MADTHFGWERGVLTEHIATVVAIEFGVLLAQETCKTLCGRRVTMAAIDNLMGTCPACRAAAVRVARAVVEACQLTPEGERDDRWAGAIAHAQERIARYEAVSGGGETA